MRMLHLAFMASNRFCKAGSRFLGSTTSCPCTVCSEGSTIAIVILRSDLTPQIGVCSTCERQSISFVVERLPHDDTYSGFGGELGVRSSPGESEILNLPLSYCSPSEFIISSAFNIGGTRLNRCRT